MNRIYAEINIRQDTVVSLQAWGQEVRKGKIKDISKSR